MRSNKRKRINILSTIALCLLLVLGCCITMMLLLRIYNDNKKLEEMQEEIDILSEEIDALSELVEEQQTQIEKFHMESEINTDAAEVTEQESEKQQKIAYIDIQKAQPGLIVTKEQVDWTNLDQYFLSSPIPEDIFQRINRNSYVENSHITLSQLRYMKVLHYNFEHQLQVGELIVNAELEQDFLNIFKELFDAGYEIQSMYLIDNYWTGDGETSDSASIDKNNTSAFCYRSVTGGSTISNHGLGRAIDINPQQNPYVDYRSGSPVWSHKNANDFIDRTSGNEHMITHDDICYKIFTKYGFEWGGDWSTIKDYQHFEKP